MDLNTKVKRSAICAGVRVVRSARLGSFSSRAERGWAVKRAGPSEKV